MTVVGRDGSKRYIRDNRTVCECVYVSCALVDLINHPRGLSSQRTNPIVRCANEQPRHRLCDWDGVSDCELVMVPSISISTASQDDFSGNASVCVGLDTARLVWTKKSHVEYQTGNVCGVDETIDALVGRLFG